MLSLPVAGSGRNITSAAFDVIEEPKLLRQVHV